MKQSLAKAYDPCLLNEPPDKMLTARRECAASGSRREFCEPASI